METQATASDLSFQDFLASIDGSKEQESFSRLSQMSNQFEQIPLAERQFLQNISSDYRLSFLVDLLDTYEPRVDFMCNLLHTQREFNSDDRSLIKAARDIGLVPANPKWFDRDKILADRAPMIVSEGAEKERFYEDGENTYPRKGYKIPSSMAVFFDGASLFLGVKSKEQFTSHIWTQSSHGVGGDGWYISDFVPVHEPDVEIFHKGMFHALRARGLADMLCHFPHAFIHSLEECVKLSRLPLEKLGHESPYSLSYEDGYKPIKPDEDPRVKEILSRQPNDLEQSIRMLKDAGYFFDPYELKTEFAKLNIPMSDGIASLVADEMANYDKAMSGIEVSRTTVEDAIKCRGWGDTMLELFYMLVSPADAKAMVQLIPGTKYEDTQEGYFLIGRNGDAEITLSYMRNSDLSAMNRRGMLNKGGFFKYYEPNWVGAISIETSPDRFIGNQEQGPMTAGARNAFCIATPVGQCGEGGDFSFCKDKRYLQLFAEMAKYVGNSMSMTHMMHTPIG